MSTKGKPTATLNIITSESEDSAKFDVDDDQVPDYIALLRDPNEVLELATRNGDAVYVPVRHITYISVTRRS